jgi:hypothetical protein
MAYGIDGGDLAAGAGVHSPAGKLLTGNIGSLCEQQPLKALRAPLAGQYLKYKTSMLYYSYVLSITYRSWLE